MENVLNDMIAPCPFCGNTLAPQILDENEDDSIPEGDPRYARNPYYQVVCCMEPEKDLKSGCGAAGGFRKTKTEAIEAWNNRTAEKTKEVNHEQDS